MKSKIIKVISNPIWAIDRILTKFYFNKRYLILHKKTHNKLMKNIFSEFTYDDYYSVVKEFIKNKYLIDYVTKEMQIVNPNYSYTPDPFSWTMIIYYIIRKTKPCILLETGVWYGFSSMVILQALHDNNQGNLISIDYPAYPEKGGYTDINPYLKKEDRTATLPKGKEPGFVIPDYLLNRWELILGESKNQLPPLLKKLKRIDFFLHDSLHTYENMTFEFELVSKHLKPFGYLFSDNIDWHTAFFDFAKVNNLKYYTYLAYHETNKLRHNFGVIKN